MAESEFEPIRIRLQSCVLSWPPLVRADFSFDSLCPVGGLSLFCGLFFFFLEKLYGPHRPHVTTDVSSAGFQYPQ